ncbi:hypothetical protein [Magnetovibrio sp.]|uniref:hypothetical protein n=1 Tax=Magnetovibrio sp. TaxID=2024836 RepID=UPI002F93C0C2
MSDNQSQADEKVEAMLDMVKRNREEQCRIIDAEAEQQARDIIARAHKDARAKVHEVIVEERRNGLRAIDKQRAKIETAKRQNLQDQENAFLEKVWQQLERELIARWQDATARQAWIDGAVDQAVAHLHPGAWRIEYPTNGSLDELKPCIERIKAFSGAEPKLIAVTNFDTGVCIEANGVRVDATLAGVLADEKEIAALLLAELFADAEATT